MAEITYNFQQAKFDNTIRSLNQVALNAAKTANYVGFQTLQAGLQRLQDPLMNRYNTIELTKQNFFVESIEEVFVRFESIPYFDKTGTIVNTDPIDIYLGDISITLNKRNSKSEVINQYGTIKEISGASDYQISFKGIIVAGNNWFKPYSELDAMNKLMKLNIPLKVTSTFLNTYDIQYIVIEDYSFDSQAGIKNAFPMSFKAVSDDPNLKIITL